MSDPGEGHWWQTLDILAGKEEKKPRKDIMADVDEWLSKITAKIQQQQKESREQAQKDSQEERRAEANGDFFKKEKNKPPKIEKYEFLETTFGKHIEIECK